MKHTLPLFISLASLGAASAQTVLINELDSDQPGADTGEFIELVSVDASGVPIGNVPLDGFVVVFFNGNNNASTNAFDLDGFSTSADGYFVLGNEDVPGRSIVLPTNSIQNSEEGVGLYLADATDFEGGTPATNVGIVDALVFTSGDGDDIELEGFLAPEGVTLMTFDEGPSVDGISLGRQVDGGVAFSNDFVQQGATPNVSNVALAAFSLTLPSGLTEGQAPTTGTVSYSGSALDVDVVVDLFNFDSTELAVPFAVTIPANSNSATFEVAVVDDLWADGTRSSSVTASTSTVNIAAASENFTVADNGDPAATLVVNEFYPQANFDSIDADANRDNLEPSFANGSADNFIELVNNGTATMDLSGFMIQNRGNVDYTFPDGISLEPGSALVVFAFISREGIVPGFGGAQVLSAGTSAGDAFPFRATDDSVRILNSDGIEISGADYDSVEDTRLSSLVLSPEVTGTNYVVHIDQGADIPFSPGYRIDALQPFGGLEGLSFGPFLESQLLLTENGDPETATLTRSGDLSEALTVTVTSSDTSEATVPATVTFAAGSAEVEFDVSPVDDPILDGEIEVEIIASAAGFADAQTLAFVLSDADMPVSSETVVFINEVNAENLTVDGNFDDLTEFVELFTPSGNVSLEGLVLVFYNGGDQSSYNVFDLNELSTNEAGFLVIGSAGVAGVTAETTLPANSIQNGADAVAIVAGVVSAFPNDSGFPASESIVDAVVYETDEDLAIGLGVTFGDTFPAEGESAASGERSIQRIPDGGTLRNSTSFVSAVPTPNASNANSEVILGSAAYEAFADANGITGSPSDDDDSDGIPNAVEFAIAGFGPGTTDAIPVPVGNLLSIAKSSEAGMDDDTTIIIEVSTDLLSFDTMDTTVVTDDATSLVVEYTGDSPRVFFRVNVTTAPATQ